MNHVGRPIETGSPVQFYVQHDGTLHDRIAMTMQVSLRQLVASQHIERELFELVKRMLPAISNEIVKHLQSSYFMDEVRRELASELKQQVKAAIAARLDDAVDALLDEIA